MRKRSSYRPRPVNANTLGFVVSGMQRLTDNPDATTLRLRNHSALYNARTGSARKGDVSVLMAVLNITEALAVKYGKGRDWCAEIEAAQVALRCAAQRGANSAGHYTFSEQEVSAVLTGMDVHDAQLDDCAVIDVERATDHVCSEIKAGRTHHIT